MGKYKYELTFNLEASEDPTKSIADQKMNAKMLKRKLVKVLHSKIEKIKDKQLKKR